MRLPRKIKHQPNPKISFQAPSPLSFLLHQSPFYEVNKALISIMGRLRTNAELLGNGHRGMRHFNAVLTMRAPSGLPCLVSSKRHPETHERLKSWDSPKRHRGVQVISHSANGEQAPAPFFAHKALLLHVR